MLIPAAATAGDGGAGEGLDPSVPQDRAAPALAAAPEVEQQTIHRLVAGAAWPRRALAAMRLERYACQESGALLERLRGDQSWQVRAFAIRTLGRRRAALPEDGFASEYEPRVLRAALRHGYALDAQRVDRGVRYLARSDNLEDKMLAVELGAASGNADLEDLARETLRTIILRMGRVEAGALSPRLAAVTGAADLRRSYLWTQWLRKVGRKFALLPARRVPEAGDPPAAPGMLASLEPQQFADLEGYVDDLSRRHVDLAICLDCTASMTAELAEAQGGIDDLMLFAGDVVASLRVGLVAYRDVRDEFETKGWDFTSTIETARRNLWTLSAAGGGDQPEAVFPALRLAYGKLSWNTAHTGILVLVGDGPPHVGYGTYCVDMAHRAAASGVVTHVIQADKRKVKYFAEIAEAGGGRLVSLPEGGEDSLIVEIAGLALGERFQQPLREFFRTYLDLCR